MRRIGDGSRMATDATLVPMNARTSDEIQPNSDPDDAFLRFDDFEYDLKRGELRGANGGAIALRPKADALLRRFLAELGRLLSRDTLMATLWPNTVVTDDSLVQCVGELRGALGERGPRLVQTVPRRGYRLDAAVLTVPAAEAMLPLEPPRPDRDAKSAPTEVASVTMAPKRRTATGIFAAALAVVAAGTATFAWRWAPAPRMHIDEAIAERTTVAILPFTTSVAGPALRQAADAVENDIAAQFATRRGMRGIGRAATARYAGDPDAMAHAGRDLHASKVLVGHIQPAAADRLDIDVQLVIVRTHAVLWARRFETTPAAITAGTTGIGLHVVNAVRSGGDRPDSATAGIDQNTSDPAELTLLGWNDIDRMKSASDALRARSRFETALRADPDSLIALNGLAATYFRLFALPSRQITAAERDGFERAVERAYKAGPNDSTALLVWGAYQLTRGRPELALPAFDKALGIVPSYANAHTLRAQALLLLGRTGEVQAEADRAIALAHADVRTVGRAYLHAAEAALMRGDDVLALELARRGVGQTPSNPYLHAVLAAAEANAGNAEQAASEVSELQRLWPGATIARYDERQPSTVASFTTQRQSLYAALRQAGLPQR